MIQIFYTLQEAAKLLRVSERSIFRYIKNGKLKGSNQGKWRFTDKDLNAFLGGGRKSSKKKGKR